MKRSIDAQIRKVESAINKKKKVAEKKKEKEKKVTKLKSLRNTLSKMK